MTEKQQLLAEVLKLKLYLVSASNKHQLTVYTEDMLDKVNELIKFIEDIKE